MGACNSTNDRRRTKPNNKQESPETEAKINEANQNSTEKQITEFNNNSVEKNIVVNNDNMNNNNLKTSQNNNNNINNNNNYGLNYYLICPDCSMRSPHIEKIYYDDNNKDFTVKYSCICQENPKEAKKVPLLNILSNKEPINTCNIHLDNKLISFCKDCNKAICNICKDEQHKEHSFEDNMNNNINKEDADNMLELIKQKEQQFNIEINQNEEKMENGIDNMIQKLNNEKQNYKKQLENYKDNNLKTFEFLKNLYGRYINNCEKKEGGDDIDQNSPAANPENTNNNNNDIMLANHINKFTIDSRMPKLNSNVDEIINQYNEEQKELKLKYDYGFPYNNCNSLNYNQSRISECNTFKSKREFTCTKTFEGHFEKIVSLIQLSSGKLASGSYDNTVRIWNMDTLKEDKIINENGRVFALLEFEKDKLLTGTSADVVNIWDINSKDANCLFSFSGHELWINCLVKINELYFASASNDAKIKIWDYYNRKCLYNLIGHKDCILSLIILKNNYLCSGSADLTIKVWDWKNRTCVYTLTGHTKWVKSVFELDNGILVSGSDDKTIKLWKDYNLISTLEDHKHSVRTFCQINSNYFASGSFDCTIKIWDINTLECIQTLTGHNSNIICIISLNDNNDNPKKSGSIASCSNDKTIKIWEGIL